MLRVPPLTAFAAVPEPPGAVPVPVDALLHAASPSPTAPTAATHVSALLFRVMRSSSVTGQERPCGGFHQKAADCHARHAARAAAAVPESRHGSATRPS